MVFDVIFEDTKDEGTVTLDSGAGVSVWPEGLHMVAANGTEIRNLGQKVIKFRGVGVETRGVADPTSGRPK